MERRKYHREILHESDPRIDEIITESFAGDVVFGPTIPYSESVNSRILSRTVERNRNAIRNLHSPDRHLFPQDVFEYLQKMPLVAALSSPKKLMEAIFTCTDRDFFEIMQLRAEYLLPILEAKTEKLNNIFYAERSKLLKFLGESLECSAEQKVLLEKRFLNLGIGAIDPCLGDLEVNDGLYDPAKKYIQISATCSDASLRAVLIHEMLHALSSRQFVLDQFVDLESEGEDQDDEFGKVVSTNRTGIAFPNFLEFLNEGATEMLTREYLRNDSELEHKSDGIYEQEIDLIRRMQFLPFLGASMGDKNSPFLEQAIRNMKAAGVSSINQNAYDLFFRAMFLDHVSDSGGRAEHWRRWSAFMRTCFGDGVLVELDAIWQKTAYKKGRYNARLAVQKMLLKRIVAKWNPQSKQGSGSSRKPRSQKT